LSKAAQTTIEAIEKRMKEAPDPAK
jgi:hypothetical protein